MAKRKQIVPGSIFTKEGTEKLTIKYRGVHYSIGIDDTPQGRKIAAEMLNTMHFNYINYNQLPFQAKKISEAFKEFEKDHCKGLSKATIHLYKTAYETINPVDFNLTHERIDSEVITFTTNYADKVKQSTITNYLRHYSVFINYCFKKEWIRKYPEKLISERKVSKKKESKKEIIPFEKFEFELLVSHFLKEAKEAPTEISRNVANEFALLLLLLWHTGGRIGETLELLWSQVDLKTRRIRYANKTLKYEDDYIPISSVVVEILKKLKECDHGEKVFRWGVGTQSRLVRRLNAAMKKLNIDKKDRAFHAIRRTFATNLFEENVSIADVKDIMRHRDIKTTLEHYKAKNAQRLESIVEKSIAKAGTAPQIGTL